MSRFCVSWLLAFVFACGLVFWPTSAQAQPAGKRVALLVGNQAYGVGALRYPAQDVATLRAALMDIGFKPVDIAVLSNGDQRQMRRALADFGERSRGAEVAFLYYSGHATQARGQNWLIPIGADIRKEADYELEAVSAQAALTQLQDAAPGLSVVVLDACRDNPVAVTRSGTKGLGRMDAGSSTVLAFATAPNTTAADDGLYAQVLAAQLRKPGQEILDVFRNTGAEVRARTANRQAPRVSEVDLPTRFYLAGPSAGGHHPQAQQSERESQEAAALLRMQADYATLNDSNQAPTQRVEGWERFLATWGDGHSAGAAGALLAQRAVAQLTIARSQRVLHSGEARQPGVDSDSISWLRPSTASVIGRTDAAGRSVLRFGGQRGDPVHAAASGRVVYAGAGVPGYGKLIVIKHSARYLSAYAHHDELLVAENQDVAAGQLIGRMGSTGTDRVMLQFEIRDKGVPIAAGPLLGL